MVTTRRGTSTAGKATTAPKKGKRLYKDYKAAGLLRRQGMDGKVSHKSSQWANGGPRYKNGKVKYTHMSRHKRKNLYSGTKPNFRVEVACHRYKAGNKKRTKEKKVLGARKAVCGGGVHVCGYVKRSKKGKRFACKGHCKKN